MEGRKNFLLTRRNDLGKSTVMRKYERSEPQTGHPHLERLKAEFRLKGKIQGTKQSDYLKKKKANPPTNLSKN
jgi:hypothetical protein